MTTLTDAQVARVAHEANTAYCWELGDESALHWDQAPDWQKESAIKGVTLLRSNLFLQPEDTHVAWMADKLLDGWVYGPVKDAAAKTHPCLVPYMELSDAQRRKDAIFVGVVRALTQQDAVSSHPGMSGVVGMGVESRPPQPSEISNMEFLP
jgi:hypothetical protein